MTPLTQYGRMAEKHWREHRPKMVRELERKGLLHQMLVEAEEKTKDEMATLRLELMKLEKRHSKRTRKPGKWFGRNISSCHPRLSSRPPSGWPPGGRL